MSNGVLARVANAKEDAGRAEARSAEVYAENAYTSAVEHGYVADPAGCHGKWDIPIAFAVALAMHFLMFLALWRHENVPTPSREMTVSIDYLGPSSQGKAAEASVPMGAPSAPSKQKPTRTNAHVSPKPTVSKAEVASLTVEATPAVEPAQARQMAESSEVPGNAKSPAAVTTTNVVPSAAGAVATQSVLASGELSVSCSDRTPPVYPKLSLRLGEQGRTLLLVELDERGRVANVSVKAGSGFSRLDEAAINAVKNWRCTPAMRNGVAVRSVATQPFNFALAGH